MDIHVLYRFQIQLPVTLPPTSSPDNTSTSGGTSGIPSTSDGQLGIYPGIDMKPKVIPDWSTLFYTLRPDFIMKFVI